MMAIRDRNGVAGARGSALLVAMLFLTLFASLAVAIAAAADVNLTISRNRVEAHQASALAETGVLLLMQALGGAAVTPSDDAEDLHEDIVAHLADAWADSGMVDADDLWADAEGVYFPAITVERDDGRVGTIALALSADGGVLTVPAVAIESTGQFGNATRTVRYRMTTQGGDYTLGAYGIASRSRVQMTGNARIEGATSDDEGCILSATYSYTQAVNLTGNVSISGDVGVCNSAGQIQKSGSVHVGGDEVIGASEPFWPEVDPSVFEPYVESTLSGSTKDKTFTNVRIPAGTNPKFTGNTTICGVLYIESPNNVEFAGNTTVTGVIVAEKPEVANLAANQVQFTGNVSTAGVESLPNEPRFAELRNMTGSFLLADGYAVSFTGNFSTINGCIVASDFSFSGNARGTVKGGILNLNDSDFTMAGNARLTIDKETADNQPVGLRSPYVLVCVPGSYEE